MFFNILHKHIVHFDVFTILSDPCQVEYTFLQGRCYRFSSYHRIAWLDARLICLREHGDLAHIGNEAEMTSLLQWLHKGRKWIICQFWWKTSCISKSFYGCLFLLRVLQVSRHLQSVGLEWDKVIWSCAESPVRKIKIKSRVIELNIKHDRVSTPSYNRLIPAFDRYIPTMLISVGYTITGTIILLPKYIINNEMLCICWIFS